ncbi:MAG: AMP-binding protein [Burkholderiales bacterium]
MTNLWNVKEYTANASIKVAGDTIPALFWNAVNKRGSKTWLREKKFGIWRGWTWNDAARVVREIGNGLLAIGFEPHVRSSILANTRVEWLLADLAVLSCGGASNGIYPTDSIDQVHYLCEDSSTEILFVEDEEQLDKALEARKRLPLLRKIIVFDMKGLREFDDPMVLGFDKLCEMGRQYEVSHPQELQQRIDGIKSDDLGILVYTSGTTGRAKGVMFKHSGMIHTLRHSAVLLPQDESDERMCFLPLCHIAERIGGAYASIYNGAILSFVENPATVPENVREIAPTTLLTVPRIWEKFYSAVQIALKESTTLQQKLYGWAIGVGEEVADCFLAGRPIGLSLKVRFTLARWLSLDNVRKMIGIHRARYLVTSAAPISPNLIRWYYALGIPMFEAWGQTESGGMGTTTSPGRIKLGTVGKPFPGSEVRCDPATGELLIRGPGLFAGYLNQPEKTAETVDQDGWLHTGDVGKQDEDGYFRITDRLKDIMITAGGKNITPSEIENELKFSPYITDAVLVAEKRRFVTAIIMIEQENVEKYAQDHDIPFSNYASLTRAPEIQKLIQDEIDTVNKKFARVEQVKKFFLLDTQLTAEDGELTPTMKLKRKFVYEKYVGQIDAMYAEAA